MSTKASSRCWNNDVRLARLEPGQRWNSAPADEHRRQRANAGGEPATRRTRRPRSSSCRVMPLDKAPPPPGPETSLLLRSEAHRRRSSTHGSGGSRCSAAARAAAETPGAARAALAAGDAPRALEIYKNLAQKTGPVARERRLRDRQDPERARPVGGGGRGLAALSLRLPERNLARRGGRVDHRDAGEGRRNRRCADGGDRLPAPPARQRAARRDRARGRRSVPRARRLPARGRRVPGGAVGVARARRHRGRGLLPGRLPRPRSATAAASMRCAATSAPTPTGASSGRRPSSSNRQRRRREPLAGRRHARIAWFGVAALALAACRQTVVFDQTGGRRGRRHRRRATFCTGGRRRRSTSSRPKSWSRWIGRPG